MAVPPRSRPTRSYSRSRAIFSRADMAPGGISASRRSSATTGCDVGDHRRVADELPRRPWPGRWRRPGTARPGRGPGCRPRRTPSTGPPGRGRRCRGRWRPTVCRPGRPAPGCSRCGGGGCGRRQTPPRGCLAKSQMYRARSSMGLFSITVAGGTRCPAASAAGSVDYRYLPGAGFGGGFSNSHRATSGAPGSTFSRRSCIWRRLLTLKTSVNVSACDGSVNFIRAPSARQ